MRLHCSFTATRHDGQHGCTVITTASKVKAVMPLIAGHCLIVLAITLVQIPKCPEPFGDEANVSTFLSASCGMALNFPLPFLCRPLVADLSDLWPRFVTYSRTKGHC
jgi:hypothetical protein